MRPPDSPRTRLGASLVLPVEFTNFHAISISADLRGRDRLDQKARPAFFSYEGDAPYLVALVKEG